MPTVALIDKRVRDLQPEAKIVFLWDAKLPSFGVRITPAGTKAYVVGQPPWPFTGLDRVHADPSSRSPPFSTSNE